MKKLFIVGAGGFGREVLWLAERINETDAVWNIEGFLDDDTAFHGTLQDGYPVFGGCNYLNSLNEEVYAVVAIGSARVRKNVVKKLDVYGHVHFATLIDPSVLCSKHTDIGEGCILCAGTVLTTDITVGKHVIINLDCTIGHDAILSDFVTLYPSVNVSGQVKIGGCTEVGTGSNIIQGKSIGSGTVIGAGTVVVNDIPDDCTTVGSPGRIIKYHADI